MSAGELGLAAATLRKRARQGLEGLGVDDEWTVTHITGWACDGGLVLKSDEDAARYIATVRPSVGFALAGWLDHARRQLGELEPADSHPGLIVARLINWSEL